MTNRKKRQNLRRFFAAVLAATVFMTSMPEVMAAELGTEEELQTNENEEDIDDSSDSKDVSDTVDNSDNSEIIESDVVSEDAADSDISEDASIDEELLGEEQEKSDINESVSIDEIVEENITEEEFILSDTDGKTFKTIAFNSGVAKDVSEYNMSWDAKKNILTLNGVNIIGTKGSTKIELPPDSTIIAKGQNKLIYCGIKFNGNGTIKGSGSLYIEQDDCFDVIECEKGDLKISETTLNLKFDNTSWNSTQRSSVIYLDKHSATIENADITITAKGYCNIINAYERDFCSTFYDNSVTINSSTVNIENNDSTRSSLGVVVGAKELIIGSKSKFSAKSDSLESDTNYLIYVDKFVQEADSEVKLSANQKCAVFAETSIDIKSKFEAIAKQSAIYLFDVVENFKIADNLHIIQPLGGKIKRASSAYTSVVDDDGSAKSIIIDDRTPISFEKDVVGNPCFGGTLTAGAVTPSGATVNYQWMVGDSPDGSFTELEGATDKSFTLSKSLCNDIIGKYIKCVVEGYDEYFGKGESNAVGPISGIDLKFSCSDVLKQKSDTLPKLITFNIADSDKKYSLYTTSNVISSLDDPENPIFPGTKITAKVKDENRYTKNGLVFYSILVNGKRVYADDWRNEEITFTVDGAVNGEEDIVIDENSFIYAPLTPKAEFINCGKEVVLDFTDTNLDFGMTGTYFKFFSDCNLSTMPMQDLVMNIYEKDSGNKASVYSVTFEVNSLKHILVKDGGFSTASADSNWFRNSRLVTSQFEKNGEQLPLDCTKDYLVEFKWFNDKNGISDRVFESNQSVLKAYSPSALDINTKKRYVLRYPSEKIDGSDISQTISFDMNNSLYITDYYSCLNVKNIVCDNENLFSSMDSYYYDKKGTIKLVANYIDGKLVTGSGNISGYDEADNVVFRFRVDVVANDADTPNIVVHPEVTSASINIFQNSGVTIPISVVGPCSNEISGYYLVDANGKESEYFRIEEVDYKTLKLIPKMNYYDETEAANMLMKTKTLTYSIRAKMGTNYVDSDKKLSLKLSKTLPKVTVKAVALNTFYENDVQKLNITSTNGKVTKVVCNTAKTPVLPSWLVINEDDLSVASVEMGLKGSVKVNIKAYVEGYDAPADVVLSVSAASKLPNVKLKETSLTIPDNIEFSTGDYIFEKSGDCCIYYESKDKAMTLADYRITGVRVANDSDLAKLSSKDAEKYQVSRCYKVDKADLKNGVIQLAHNKGSVSLKTGKVLLIFTVGGNSKQEFSLPLDIKVVSFGIKNNWKLSKTSVTLNNAGKSKKDVQSVSIKYPYGVGLPKNEDVYTYIYKPDGKPEHYNLYADYIDGELIITCNSMADVSTSKAPYTIEIWDRREVFQPLKLKVNVVRKMPKLSFKKNTATFIHEQREDCEFQTNLICSDKAMTLGNDGKDYLIVELTGQLVAGPAFDGEAEGINTRTYYTNTDGIERKAYDVAYDRSTGIFSIKQYPDRINFDGKDKTYKFALRYRDNVAGQAVLTVKSIRPDAGAGKLTLKPDKTSIKLNIGAGLSKQDNYNSADFEKTIIKLSNTVSNINIDNAEMHDVFKIYADKAKKDLIYPILDSDGKVSGICPFTIVDYDKISDGNIELKVQANYNSNYIKSVESGKSKTFYLEYSLNYGTPINSGQGSYTASTTIPVTVSNVEPTITLKASGNIDSSNLNKVVKITSTAKNINAAAMKDVGQLADSSIRVTGVIYKNDVIYDGLVYDAKTGEVSIDKDSSEYKNNMIVPSDNKNKYTIELQYESTEQLGGMTSGNTKYITTKRIPITIKNTAPKIVQDVKNVDLYKYDCYDTANVTLTLPEGCPEIQLVKLNGTNTDYRITPIRKNEAKGMYIYAIGFANKSVERTKAAKKATLKLDVYLKGTSQSSKANATVSVVVNPK